jgi:hypothetical protein
VIDVCIGCQEGCVSCRAYSQFKEYRRYQEQKPATRFVPPPPPPSTGQDRRLDRIIELLEKLVRRFED